MPARERPEESRARRIIEATLGVTLTYADLNGGVDYLFSTDLGTAAMEVTTVTSSDAKRDADAWVKARASATPPTTLTRSWSVVVNDQVEHKSLHARLEPILRDLERTSIHQAYSLLDLPPSARGLATRLYALKVEGLLSQPPAHGQAPMVFVKPMIGYTSEGSAQALNGIEADLNAHTDNVHKLREANVDERHLFVWLDLDTPGPIRRPLESGPGELDDHFGLPHRDPAVDQSIDTLWIVHAVTGHGWRWSTGTGWSHLSPTM